MRKICIVTGTRAEYGLLKPVIKKIHESKDMELQLVVTGMHLSTEFGLTYREIEEDGFPIASKIEMLLGSDTPVGISKSMGVAFMGLADFYETSRPDMVILLGDRFEMLVCAVTALIARIPIAHIGGGEKTEGAIDEAIRHSITKMAALHFTETEEYRDRVIQLGEQPGNVYNVGSLGAENIRSLKLSGRKELEEQTGFRFSVPVIMVTYHPVTLEKMTSEEQFGQLLAVLDKHKECSIIFTKSNADADGRIINHMIDCFVERNKDRCVSYASLGQLKYLSALQFCTAVMGNSSSGIIEVPSFKIPTINVGDRQRGRICAQSVIHCANDVAQIEAALVQALSPLFQSRLKDIINPYEKEGTSDMIIQIIKSALDNGIELKKRFYDLNWRQLC